MPTYVHLVRHAQGYHNLTGNHHLRDPDLTPIGTEQCARLQKTFPLLPQITHLVASPLRRTIYTCLLSFEPALQNPGIVTKKVIAFPQLQEVSPMPCDTGSELDKLVAEFGPAGQVDLGLVTEGWNDKVSASSPYVPEMHKLETRARNTRLWLRELGAKFEAENPGVDAHIVAVTHGGFLHFLTQDWDGMNPQAGTGWENTEWRTYGFVNGEDGDDEAGLRETGVSWRRRRGSEKGLSETEQMELRSAVTEGLEVEKRRWAENGKAE